MARWLQALHRFRAALLESAGLFSIAAGVYQVNTPAAFIFAGAALVFIAQGMERDE